MGIEGLQTVFVTYDDHITICSKIFGHPHLACECSMDRISCLERDIDTLMATSATHTELSSVIYFRLKRTMILVETVNQPKRPGSRKVCQLHLIWIGVHLIPMLIKDTCKLLVVRSLVVLPCIITVEDDLHMLIDSVKGVYRVIWRCDKRLQRL